MDFQWGRRNPFLLILWLGSLIAKKENLTEIDSGEETRTSNLHANVTAGGRF